ncbi:hypothetical protein NUSPORA_02384 [Nucleospora cyclopteri]
MKKKSEHLKKTKFRENKGEICNRESESENKGFSPKIPITAEEGTEETELYQCSDKYEKINNPEKNRENDDQLTAGIKKDQKEDVNREMKQVIQKPQLDFRRNISPDLARELLRVVANREIKNEKVSTREVLFPAAALQVKTYKKDRGKFSRQIAQMRKYSRKSSSYDSNETVRSKSTDVIKIEPPAGSENLKSFNDFSEHIFTLNPKTNQFQCPVQECAKEFPSLSRIKRHFIIHTDIKPFKCKNKGCDRRFSRKDNMLQHYRMHCQYGQIEE